MKDEKLYIFSRPFGLPFRIADLIYAFPSSQSYCLLYDDSSEDFVFSLLAEVREEFANSQAKANFIACSSADCCLPNSRKIAFFENNEADVSVVDRSQGDGVFAYGDIFVNNRKTFFVDKELILGAIFSDNYECNLKRVMTQVKRVSRLYAEKTRLLEQTQECSYEGIRESLGILIQQQNNYDLYSAAREIEEANARLNCAQVY